MEQWDPGSATPDLEGVSVIWPGNLKLWGSHIGLTACTRKAEEVRGRQRYEGERGREGERRKRKMEREARWMDEEDEQGDEGEKGFL